MTTHSYSPAVAARRRIAIALLVAGTFFMENLDGTVIATALPAMARGFAVEPVDLNIGMSAYLVTLGIFIPASGWLADRFGARRVFASAIALFTLASILCGIAQSVPVFVTMRVLQGLGGAMMVPVGRLIVLGVTPKERLVSAIATLTWPALVAPILGPPIGGFIAEHASWRWIFYLNLPLGLLAFALVFALIDRTEAKMTAPFDGLGFVLSGAGIASTVIGVEAIGGARVAWPVAMGWIAVGLLLLLGAVRHFHRRAGPLLDLAGMNIPTFAVTIRGGSLFRMAIGAVPFLLPLMFQSAFGYDAFHAGLLMMAVFAGNLAIKPATTSILRLFGFRRVLIGNGMLNAITLAACALLTPHTPIPVIAALLFTGGMCRSMQFTALNTIAFADIAPDAMTGANTFFSTAMQLTMGLGIAVGALALRTGEMIAGEGLAAFQMAFVLTGLLAMLGVADSLKLASGVGGELVG